MKNIQSKIRTLLLIIAITAILPLFTNAQHFHPEQFDVDHNIHTGDAGMLSLVADKYLMELNETNLLTVRINWVNPGDDSEIPQQYDYRFADDARAPWKITKWEILEGGGTLTEGPDHYYASYSSPSTMPAKKYATIAVTLMPQDPTKPKVQLLQTIYFADNDNVFYYNCPGYGVNKEKYVITGNGGGLVSPNSISSTQKAMQAGNAAQRAQLEALQKKLEEVNKTAKQTGEEKNMDIDLMTSNIKAIYTKTEDQDFTTIQLQGKVVAMENGQPSTKKRDYFITLTFPGQAPGTYKIKSKDIISASVSVYESPLMKVCGCAYDPSRDPKGAPECSGGIITITKYDNKIGGYIEGTVLANIEGAIGQQVIFGDLDGKFKVKLAKN